MNIPVDIWLRGDDFATTATLDLPIGPATAWSDADVRLVLGGMLRAMYRQKYPDREDDAVVALRGLSWIVNPFEEGGVVIAIEITLGAAIAGPFDAEQSALEAIIARVVTTSAAPAGSSIVH
jgi:hypothetical protein